MLDFVLSRFLWSSSATWEWSKCGSRANIWTQVEDKRVYVFSARSFHFAFDWIVMFGREICFGCFHSGAIRIRSGRLQAEIRGRSRAARRLGVSSATRTGARNRCAILQSLTSYECDSHVCGCDWLECMSSDFPFPQALKKELKARENTILFLQQALLEGRASNPARMKKWTSVSSQSPSFSISSTCLSAIVPTVLKSSLSLYEFGFLGNVPLLMHEIIKAHSSRLIIRPHWASASCVRLRMAACRACCAHEYVWPWCPRPVWWSSWSFVRWESPWARDDDCVAVTQKRNSKIATKTCRRTNGWWVCLNKTAISQVKSGVGGRTEQFARFLVHSWSALWACWRSWAWPSRGAPTEPIQSNKLKSATN